METATTKTSPGSGYQARIEQKIDVLSEDLSKTQHDIHRMKQFFLWTFIVSIVTFILPLLAAVVLIPLFLGNYMDSFGGLL